MLKDILAFIAFVIFMFAIIGYAVGVIILARVIKMLIISTLIIAILNLKCKK